MLHLIISIDYEIFGNGRGNPLKHIINPANKMLSISQKFNVPLTFMVEIFEYIAYEKNDTHLKKFYGFSPAELIRKQISKAYSNGNDIQLHIHPQFINMKFYKGNFQLKNPYATISDFDNETLEKIIISAKNKLESLIDDEQYKCKAIRFSNMPWVEAPENSLQILEKLEFDIHSLYSYGLKNKKGYWKIKKSKVTEIPIYSRPSTFFELFTLRRFFTLLYIWVNSPPNIFKKGPNNNKNKEFNKNIYKKWDISKMTYNEMVSFLEGIVEELDYKNSEIPIVLIGHTKDFFNQKNFEKFIMKIQKKYVKKNIINFSTFKDFTKYIKS